MALAKNTPRLSNLPLGVKQKRGRDAMPDKTTDNFHLHVTATTKGSDEHTDVILDDLVQSLFSRADDDESGFNVPADSDHMSFSISTTGEGHYMLQKPVVTIEGEDVSAVVVSKGKELMSKVPKSPKHFNVGLQFQCLAETVTPVKLNLRFLDVKKNTMKEMTLTFFKDCAGVDDEVQGTFFEGLFVGLRPGAKDVVEDGEATKDWEIRGDNDLPDTTIPDHMMKTTFYLQYNGAEGLALAEPFVIVEDPTVVTTMTVGALESGKYNLTNTPISLTVQYTCLQAGSTAITLGIKALEQPDLSMIWTFNKKCSEREAVEGVAINGLNIGTERGLADVVSDGITTEDFRNAFSQTEENTKQLTQFGPDVDSVTFYVSSSQSTVGLKKPIMTIARTLSNDFLHIADPAAAGSIVRANEIKQGQDYELKLVFNCVRSGSSDISVQIPLKPSGALQFVVQKTCTVQGAKEMRDAHLDPIPGLNMGTARGAANILRDGIPQSKWHWETKVIDLHMILDTTPFITLFLTKNASKTGAADIRLGAPELISTLAVSQPDISGRASSGGVVTVDSHQSITITFHCFEKGTTLFNLEMPILPMSVEEMAPRDEPIKISFLKECSTDAQEIVTGAGGVGITGFNIGTTPEGNDIVYNGFPRPMYYGQRHKDTPEWEDIIVPVDSKSTRVFFSYGSKFAGLEEPLDQVVFEAPLAVAHGGECKPTLSGPGSNGGTLKKNGGTIEMDVTWNCRFKGVGSVSIAIHILPHGKITLTIPKQCDGIDKPEGIVVPGFTVGLTQNGQEVIKDGLTTSDFLPYKPHQAPNHIEEGLSTIFYVSSPTKTVGALEPIVFCARPIANPRIIHNMHIDENSGKDWEDAVEIGITEKPQTMEIDYNCVGIGSTPVTVVIPVLPRGSQVAFTWTLTCGGSSFYDFYSFEYMDSYYDLYSDDYYYYYSDYYYDYDDVSGSYDWYYYTDDYYLIGSWSSSAYMYSESRASDEFLWSELPSTDFLYDEDRGLGWINVGTGPGTDDSDDVVSFGQALDSYALVPGAVGEVGGDDDSIDGTVYTVVSRLKETSIFYLSVPLGHEVFAPPEVFARQGSKGAVICDPKLLGDGAKGGELTADRPSVALELQYNCLRPGVTPISIKIPLGSNYLRSINFRVIKVCRDFTPRVEWYWTASRIMFFGTMIIGFFLGIFAYRTLKESKEHPTHQRVPTTVPLDDLDSLDSDSD